MTRLKFVLLTALLAAAPAARQRVELLGYEGRGDPAALAVSGDESRIFSAEGATIAVLDARSPELPELERIPVDAAIVELLWTPGRLYVAGGSQGLFVIDLTDAFGLPPGEQRIPLWRPARRVDDVGDKVCMDAALLGDHLVAVFAAQDDSELRAYDLASLELRARAALGPGRSYALAVNGREAYVAMGTGGLVRVAEEGGELRVDPGPGGAVFPAPEGFRLEPGMVRDVAAADGVLWAAADGAGLAEIDLTAPWSRETPVRLHPLQVRGKITYAGRVAARDRLVAVGTNLGPVEVVDGAPFNAFGKMGARGELADVSPDDWPRGTDEALLLFRRVEAGLAPLGSARLAGGWRGLVLGQRRVYEQHIGEGLVVRLSDRRPLPVVARRRPVGFPATDGVFSRYAGGTPLLGRDPAGSLPGGIPLLVDSHGVMAEWETVPPGADFGLLPGAVWRKGGGPVEWLVGGRGHVWSLFRLDWSEVNPVAIDRWDLVPPADPGGNRGHTYFHSELAGELLLLTRYGSSHGVVGYDRGAMQRAAEESEPGTALVLEPLFQLRTHAEAEAEPQANFRTRSTELPDGRLLIAVAAGFDGDPASATADCARLALYGLPAGAAGGEPRPLGVAHGTHRPGNAVAVAYARLQERTFACVADSGYGLWVFEVTDPEAPRLAGSWRSPPGVFDGHYDNVLDVEVAREGERTFAYLACARRGLVCLDLGAPDSPPYPVVAVRDTPGLAYGVVLGEETLVVGDHQAGLRLYGAAR